MTSRIIAASLVIALMGCRSDDDLSLLAGDGAGAAPDGGTASPETAGGGDVCPVEQTGLALHGMDACTFRDAAVLPGGQGLQLVELAIAAAPAGALAAALRAAKAELLAGDFTQCEDVTGVSVPNGCRVEGRGTFTQGALAIVEGSAFGNGFKVELGLDVESAVRLQVIMNEAQRAAYQAAKAANPANPTLPAGAGWRLGLGKSLRNSARATVKMGLEILGAGGNVQLGGSLSVASGSEFSNGFILAQAVPLETFLATEGAGSVRSVALQMIGRAQPNLMTIYASHLGSNVAAISAYVDSVSRGNGSECATESLHGDPEAATAQEWRWSRTALCTSGQLCCRGGIIGVLSLRRTSAYCYADDDHYRNQYDCQELGFSR